MFKFLFLINKCKDRFPSKRKPLLIIIGNSKYSNGSGGEPLSTKNNGLTFYKQYGFDHVAFLTDGETLDLYSILGLLTHSYNKNIKIKKYKMADFARFLYSKCNLILINANSDKINENDEDALVKKIENLLKDYPNHKVMFVGNSKNRKTDYKNLRKEDYLLVPHCAGINYGKNAKDCCKTYFKFESINEKDNISLKDFKIL